MKVLGFFLAFFGLCQIAEAAKLSSVQRLQNRDVDAYVKLFLRLGEDASIFSEGVRAAAHKVSVKEKDESEPWTNTIKQVIYWARAKDGANQAQEEVSLRRIVKKDREMEMAIKQHALRGTSGEAVYVAVRELHATLESAVSGFRHLKLFVGIDSGAFAECAFVAVLDEENSEIAVTSSCSN